jgi:hypothetical protein
MRCPGYPDPLPRSVEAAMVTRVPRGNAVAASSKLMIGEAERRFPCRIKLAIPTGGLGAQLTEMHSWLDENCGADGWAMVPAGLRGVLNDAVAIYFRDAALPPSSPVGAPARRLRSAKGRSGCGWTGRQRAPKPDCTRRSERSSILPYL